MVNAIDYTAIVKRVEIVTVPNNGFGDRILQYNIYTYMLDVSMWDYGTGKCEMVFDALGNVGSFHIFEKDNLAHINLNKLFLMELPYKRMWDRGNIQSYYKRKFV